MNIEKQIEFDKIKEKWMELAITDQAKEQIRTVSFCLSEMELRKRLKDTTDSRLLIEQIGMPPLQNVSEIKEILMIAEKGGCLTPYQLEQVEKVLAAVRRLRDYLTRGRDSGNSLAGRSGDRRWMIMRQRSFCRSEGRSQSVRSR